ncbi:PqqD family protein [Nonomuraea lactucae]|uniref:PqqD family protein n=1 Tax=Nonomuraea lactucae TaxID=2249762 RepID=UPI000DE4EEFD|nr:PqqD family protein [Nonomuraea lactucae]
MQQVIPPFRASRHVHATLTDGGGMLLDTRGRGRWHVLTATGAACWPHLARGDVTSAADTLTARWGTPTGRAHNDTLALARHLLMARLLRPYKPLWRPWWRPSE